MYCTEPSGSEKRIPSEYSMMGSMGFIQDTMSSILTMLPGMVIFFGV